MTFSNMDAYVDDDFTYTDDDAYKATTAPVFVFFFCFNRNICRTRRRSFFVVIILLFSGFLVYCHFLFLLNNFFFSSGIML